MQNDSYDHHAAIYYLLQDRLTQSRNSGSTGSPTKHQQTHAENQRYLIQETQRRRPSNIAEQVSLTGHYNMQTENNFQSLRDYSAPKNLQISALPHSHLQQIQHQKNANIEQNQPLPHDNSGGMIVSEYSCLTCGGSILENTSSTTTCVKCARLRTRRRAFAHPWDQQMIQQQQQLQHQNSQKQFQHLPSTESMGSERVRGPHDSRDSGVSSGSSQDYGECTPTTEKSLIFPSRHSFGNRVSLDRQSVQFSQLVRKLSEVEGIVPNILMKTSIDEGVCTEETTRQLPDDQQSTDQIQMNSNPDGSWRPTHQLSEGSTFDSVSLDRSCSIASPLTEQLPYHCSTEPPIEEESKYTKHNIQQVGKYPSAQSGASCSSFPSEEKSGHGQPLNNDLTTSLPSCTQGASPLPPTHYTETTKHIQLGGASHLTATAATADMEASEMSATLDISRTPYYIQHQQHYKYIPSYPQHLTPGMKRLLPQVHPQKQNFLNVVQPPHPMSSPRRVRSPICFREGRRASDGYVGTCPSYNNTIAFSQKLYDKSKAGGHFELHEVREEHKALQNQFGGGHRQHLETDTSSTVQNEEGGRCDTPLESAPYSRLSAEKRISLPENFAYFSSTSGLVASAATSSNTMSGNINVNINDPHGAPILYQQQIPLQHRMRPSTSGSRRASGRSNSYGFYPPQSHQQGLSSDFLFQPIAEDEADSVPLSPHEHSTPEGANEISLSVAGEDTTKNIMTIPPGLPLTQIGLPSKSENDSNVLSMEQDEQDHNWQALTNDMKLSCRLTENTIQDREATSGDINESNTLLNEQSAAIISSETSPHHQYSQDQINVIENCLLESESMDTSNIEK